MEIRDILEKLTDDELVEIGGDVASSITRKAQYDLLQEIYGYISSDTFNEFVLDNIDDLDVNSIIKHTR